MSLPFNSHDAEKLSLLKRCSPSASAFVNWLLARKRGVYSTKVRVAAARTGVDYYEVVALFKILDDYGFGRFVKGSRGAESRMDWRIDIRSMALSTERSRA